MSSHVSHLPADLPLSRVDGHGMNEEELRQNPAFALGTTHVQDLNREPALPFAADGAYDAVLVCCGVQYLEEAEQVFAEAAGAVPGTVTHSDLVTFYQKCCMQMTRRAFLL